MENRRWISTRAYFQMIDLVLSAAKVLSQPDLYAFYKGENAALSDLWTETSLALDTLIDTDYIRDVYDRNTKKDWQEIYDGIIDKILDEKPSLDKLIDECKKKEAFESDQRGIYEAAQIFKAMETMNMYWTEP